MLIRHSKRTKKGIFLLFSSVLLVFFLSSCTAWNENTPAVVEEALFEGSVLDEDGQVLVEYSIAYPQVEHAGDSAESINGTLLELAQEYRSMILSDAVVWAKEDYLFSKEQDSPFYPHQYDMSYETGRNDGEILSFLFVLDAYTGGAHGVSQWKGRTFSLEDGTRMGMGEVFQIPEEDAIGFAVGIALEEAEHRMDAGDLYLYEDYAELMPSTFEPEDFYVTDTACRIFYQAYTIAPYASGFVSFDIPLE